MALEIGWNLYLLHRHRSQEEELRGEIAKQVEIVGGLHQRVRQLVSDEVANKGQIERLTWELDGTSQDRDSARKEREERTEGRAKLIREKEELTAEGEKLRQEISRLNQEQIQVAQNVQNREERERELEAKVRDLEKQLRAKEGQEAMIRQIDATLEAHPLVPGTTAAEKEFAELHQLYDDQQRDYLQMLRDDKENYLPQSQIAIDGLIQRAQAHIRLINRFRATIRFERGAYDTVMGGKA